MMAQSVYTDYVGYLLAGTETTYGTKVAATKDLGLLQSVTPTDTQNIRRLYSLGSRNVQEMVAGQFNSTLSLTAKYQHGRIFEYLTGGTVTHDASDTPDIKHTYAEADALKSFSLEYGFDLTSDVEFTYTSCLVNSLTLDLNLNEELSWTADIMGQQVDTGTTASTGSIDSLKTLPSYYGTLNTGSSVAKIQSMSWTYNNAVRTLDALGSRLHQEGVGGSREMDFNMTLLFEDLTEYAQFLDGTSVGATSTPSDFDMVIDITNGTAAGSGLREVYIDVDDNKWNEASVPVSVGSEVIASFSGHGKTLSSFYSYDDIASGDW